VSSGEIRPGREEFRRRWGTAPAIPVVRSLLADAETPVGVYRKLAADRPGTFLLESAEHGGVWSRYSFVGVRSAATLLARGGQAHWVGSPPAGAPAGGPVLETVDATAAALRSPREEELPPLTGGLVGYLGYDVVRSIERLPDRSADDLGLPEAALLLAADLAVFDHSDASLLLIANVFAGGGGGDPGAGGPDAAYDDAVARLERMTADLAQPALSSVARLSRGATPEPRANMDRQVFRDGVARCREHILAGDAFQIVLSQRFDVDCSAHPLDIYRVLRAANPSPYMYLLRFGEFDVVGSSPEALVKVTGNRAMLHPIAGTRRRGATPEEDAALAAELLADPKERSEHVMLVDLGRNDLGRVCRPGTVEVVDFMEVERYSHVMHIVSTVVGEIQNDVSAIDVLTACFPAGTLSGAPKVRAMEIIESLEPTRRGVYGGAVGYIDAAGDLDTAIAIRTMVLKDGVAYVQAGAGLVADSDPPAEDEECRNKAATVLSAIAAAQTLQAVGAERE
jgi:anthranilate synthase component 1